MKTAKMVPPREFYISTWDWVAKSNFKGRSNYFRRLDLEQGSPIFAKPKGLDATVHWKFLEEKKRRPPFTFVAALPYGRVWGSNGTIITPDNKLLWEVSPEYGVTADAHSIFQQKRLPLPVKYNGTVAVLTFCSSQMYYHWMFDILARLDLIRRAKFRVDKIVINLNGNRPFQQETLQLFGIPKEQVIVCHRNLHLRAKRLIVPSLAGYTGQSPKWACHFLRSNFLRVTELKKNSGSERIYISREDANARKIKNEDQVVRILASHGFKKVVLESMSVADQIKLVASAKAIVSAHGSGLTNLLFCRAGTKVLEFFSPSYVNVLYWTLCNNLNLEYFYLIGEGEGPEEFIDPHLVWEDIVINPDKLEAALKLVFS